MNPQPSAWLFAPSHTPGGAEQGTVPCHRDKSRSHAQPPKEASQERLIIFLAWLMVCKLPTSPVTATVRVSSVGSAAIRGFICAVSCVREL